MSLGSKKWLKYVLTISLAVTPLVGTESFAASSKAACQDQLLNQCNQAQAGVTATQQSTIAANMGGTTTSAQQFSNAANTAKAQGVQAAIDCGNLASSCDQVCKTDKEKKACKDAVTSKASDIKAQSDANGSAGNSSGMMAGLMGAALGAGLGYMLAKKQQDDANAAAAAAAAQPVATGALQLNGSLNCQMADSYKYEDCNSFLAQYCQAQTAAAVTAAQTGTALNTTPMTGTVISAPGGTLPPTPDCASFNAGYCGSSATPPTPYGLVRADGSVTQVNLAGTGEGLGTSYCSSQVAMSWCSQAAGRSTCPACQYVANQQSVTCAANPALCIAQNSTQVTNTAVAGTCSGDPLYTPGSPYALPGVTGTTNTLVAGGVSATNGGSGLPVVVLPSSTGSVGSTNGTSGSTGGGIAVTSATGAAANGGVREGRGIASASGASGGGGGVGGGMKPSSAHVGQSELIAAGGVIVASGASSGVSRGPASDVEAKFGPSLFATSSNVIRAHCQEGKLNNCP